jgi:hypothetical protein
MFTATHPVSAPRVRNALVRARPGSLPGIESYFMATLNIAMRIENLCICVALE